MAAEALSSSQEAVAMDSVAESLAHTHQQVAHSCKSIGSKYSALTKISSCISSMHF